MDAGKAWQTPFGLHTPIIGGKPGPLCAAVVLQLPLEDVLRGGGIAAVLKRPPGAHPEWLTGPHRRDIFVSFAPVSTPAVMPVFRQLTWNPNLTLSSSPHGLVLLQCIQAL